MEIGISQYGNTMSGMKLGHLKQGNVHWHTKVGGVLI